MGKICGQATKGAWWMPWQSEAMKDVVNCDKPRGAVKQAVIRGFPNGETWQGNTLSSVGEYIAAGGHTQGSETSQYLQEKKATAIPLVAASERGGG